MNRSDRIIPVGAEPPSMDPPRQPPTPKAPDRPVAKGGRPRRKGDLARRFGLFNAVVDYAIRDMHCAELAAFVILWRHAKADGTVSASIADLARRGGCSRRAIQNGIKRLITKRLLERIKRGTLEGGPTLWRLVKPDPPEG
jgi:hypothetical protein